MIIEIDGFCEKGLQREDNQDCVFAAFREEGAVAVVADGMGGHADGGKASAIVCRCVREWWDDLADFRLKNEAEALACELEMVLGQANQEIRLMAGEGVCCGSTAAALLLTPKNWALLSVGDTRCYRAWVRFLRGMEIHPLAPDDVWEEQENVRRHLTRREIERHPDFGKLVRAVGTENTFSCHFAHGSIHPGTAFFLCSDGIYKYCEKKVLKRAFRRITMGENIKEGLEMVRTAVYENGAPDNLSLIAVRINKMRGK